MFSGIMSALARGDARVHRAPQRGSGLDESTRAPRLVGVPRCRILLVAKPWRGGLATYVRLALEAISPGAVDWLPTYPVTATQRVEYAQDRARWRARLLSQVNASDHTAVLFINHHRAFVKLPRRDRYVLWVTDDPTQDLEGLRSYAKVCISDPGYREEVASALGERFAGVVPFAYSQAIHYPISPGVGGRGLCMIGNRDRKRDEHLRAIKQAGHSPMVYGNYFARHPLFWEDPGSFRPPIPNTSMGRVYARFAASLSIHAQVVRGGTNMRSFECAAYGVSQITELRPGLDALFEPDEEIATFNTRQEAPEVIAQVLRDRHTAGRFAERARKRAFYQHRYEHRVATLLHDLVPQRLLRPWHLPAA